METHKYLLPPMMKNKRINILYGKHVNSFENEWLLKTYKGGVCAVQPQFEGCFCHDLLAAPLDLNEGSRHLLYVVYGDEEL